jgi:CRISPR system Cascade subunit CasB
MTELKKPRLFEEDHPASDYILEWWKNLKQNKGDRAELRRCKNLEEIQKASAYQRCYWQLKKYFTQEQQVPSREQMSIIIGLATHIEDNDTKYIDTDSKKEKEYYFAYQMAAPKGKGKDASPKLSELRFRRLLKIKDRENLYHFLIQVIRMLDKKVNLLNLLSIAYFWGDKAKTSLAYKYYEKANLEAQ